MPVEIIHCTLKDATKFYSADGKSAIILTTPDQVRLAPEQLVFKGIETEDQQGNTRVQPGMGITSLGSVILQLEQTPTAPFTISGYFENVATKQLIKLTALVPATAQRAPSTSQAAVIPTAMPSTSSPATVADTAEFTFSP